MVQPHYKTLGTVWSGSEQGKAVTVLMVIKWKRTHSQMHTHIQENMKNMIPSEQFWHADIWSYGDLTLLHSEWPQLYGVLAILSAVGLKWLYTLFFHHFYIGNSFYGFLIVFRGQQNLSGGQPVRERIGSYSWPLFIEKGGKYENCRLASPESVPVWVRNLGSPVLF